MKKFVIVGSDLIVLDTDTMDVDAVGNCSTSIDWMYIAPDDGVLNDGTPVKKGQLIVRMYGVDEGGPQELPRKTIVIQDEIFTEHVRKFNEISEAKRNCYQRELMGKTCCPA